MNEPQVRRTDNEAAEKLRSTLGIRRDGQRRYGDLLDAALDWERRRTVEPIATARQRISECPTPGNCMYPQHHSDDESATSFAMRLQQMARTILNESEAPHE